MNDRDAAVSVRDAQVSEGPGATLEFAVTLDRALDQDQDVTVKYATSDGTATAGEDYTHSAGDPGLFGGRYREDGLGAGARRCP